MISITYHQPPSYTSLLNWDLISAPLTNNKVITATFFELTPLPGLLWAGNFMKIYVFLENSLKPSWRSPSILKNLVTVGVLTYFPLFTSYRIMLDEEKTNFMVERYLGVDLTSIYSAVATNIPSFPAFYIKFTRRKRKSIHICVLW